ncbi:MBL fold metallo-hydrolase [Pedobacter sp. GSP4]|uniref:MBL fold metallo-hydrolase n=1 Tax=Pedobacter sp. GSP4 TaxID=3453716 RepID=UPI003EEBBBE3
MIVSLTHINTACVLLEINGYRILTDPTLDDAGGLYYHGFGAFSRKTANPGLTADQLQDIDLVLLSHHQHKDNLDTKGRAFLGQVKTIISTVPASKDIKGITGLEEWQSYAVYTPKVKGLKITATPAQHRPSWIPEFVSGKVIGFIIEAAELPNGAIYLSGDTVFFKGIAEIGRRYKIDVAVMNVGGVEFRYLTGLGKYTMDGLGLIKAANVLNPKRIFPVHSSGWTHFKQKETDLKVLLMADELIKNRTYFLVTGQKTFVINDGIS